MYCFTYISLFHFMLVYLLLSSSPLVRLSLSFFSLSFLNLSQTGLLLQIQAQCGGSWILRQVVCTSGDRSVGEAPCELHFICVIFGDPADRFVLRKLDIWRIFLPDDVHLNDSGVQFSIIEIHTDFGSGCHLHKNIRIQCQILLCKYSNSKPNTVCNFLKEIELV